MTSVQAKRMDLAGYLILGVCGLIGLGIVFGIVGAMFRSEAIKTIAAASAFLGVVLGVASFVIWAFASSFGPDASPFEHILGWTVIVGAILAALALWIASALRDRGGGAFEGAAIVCGLAALFSLMIILIGAMGGSGTVYMNPNSVQERP